MIGVLDLGLGNLRSVVNAIDAVGFDAMLLSDGRPFDNLSHLVIPGVGHFGAAMEEVQRRNLVPAIQSFAATGRPILGICLGMQLLMSKGTEGGATSGLDLIPGTVRQLPPVPSHRMPHTGWSTVAFERRHQLLAGIKDRRDFYFVHSYVVHCDLPDHVIAQTEYGVLFPSVVGRGAVVGFQFHPEKSQGNGLRLLENFCGWHGEC